MVILENDLKRHIQSNRIQFHNNIKQRIKDKNLSKNEIDFLQHKINKDNISFLFMWFYGFSNLLFFFFMIRFVGVYAIIFFLLGMFLPIFLSEKNIYNKLEKVLKNDDLKDYFDELFESQVVDQQTLSYFKSKHGKNALQVILTAKENITYQDIYKYEIYCDRNSNIKDISDCL